MNVSVDLNASTATYWLSNANRSQATTDSAKITDDTVTWSDERSRYEADFTLDRKTGEMNVRFPDANMGSNSYVCKRATPVL